MFTVVIPLFNKERHIERAVKSVINQTFQNFEIIVVDDGSTDNSAEEVLKIKDNRIKLIKQKNGGVSSARNKGIDEARYEYIGFLDADDAWKPNFLDSIKEIIEKYPKAGAYCTSYDIKTEDGIVIVPSNYLNFDSNWNGIIDDYFKYSLKGSLIWTSCVVIPKSVFIDLGGFPVGIKRGEDLDMWIRIALNYDIVYLNKTCATYYHDADNRACKRKVEQKYSIVSYVEDILAQGKNLGTTSIYFEEYMIKIIISKARYLIEENNRKEARKLLYKYRYTKLNRNALIKTIILSWIPNEIKDILIKSNTANKLHKE